MRYAWTWRIKPNRIDEYVRMHKEPWPEIMREHSAAGIRDYSIHRDGNQFFYHIVNLLALAAAAVHVARFVNTSPCT